MPPLFGDGKPAAHAAAALPSGSGTLTVASAAVAVDANVTSTAPSAVSSPRVRRERVEICMRVPSSYGDQDYPGRVVPVLRPYEDGQWRRIGSGYPGLAVGYPVFYRGTVSPSVARRASPSAAVIMSAACPAAVSASMISVTE